MATKLLPATGSVLEEEGDRSEGGGGTAGGGGGATSSVLDEAVGEPGGGAGAAAATALFAFCMGSAGGLVTALTAPVFNAAEWRPWECPAEPCGWAAALALA